MGKCNDGGAISSSIFDFLKKLYFSLTHTSMFLIANHVVRTAPSVRSPEKGWFVICQFLKEGSHARWSPEGPPGRPQ